MIPARRARLPRRAACAAATVALFTVATLATLADSLGAAERESAGAPAGWTDADTVLASQYLRLLQEKPEYGKVFDLLWEHYRSHDATGLLLESFAAQAGAASASASTRLVFGHLLRKSGRLEEARTHYEKLLNEPAIRSRVLLALAELARQMLDPEACETWLTRLAREENIEEEMFRRALHEFADFYLERSEPEAALGVWKRLLRRFPEDLALRQEIAGKLVAAGLLDEAIATYQPLRRDAEVERRVAVLAELARLYELADDFENAAKVLNEGRGSTHFRHHLHIAFLARLVRLYERQGRLEELETTFLEAAQGESPTEASVYTLSRFYQMTADPGAREQWLRRLVEIAPGRSEYRQDLVEVLLTNDAYQEARRELEALLEQGGEESLALRLLRVRIALNLEGRKSATDLLRDFTKGRPLSDRETGDVLRFAEANYLDDVAEALLQDRVGDSGDEAIFSLAGLHHSRGRLEQARSILREYVKESAESETPRAQRLYRAAAALQGMGLARVAIEYLEEAVALDSANTAYLLRLAELLADSGEVDRALEHYQMAWQLAANSAERVDVDQRIYSILQLSDLESRGAAEGGASPFSPPGQSSATPAIVVPGVNGLLPGTMGAAPAVADSESRLYRFYLAILESARDGGERNTLLRAAWWAHRMQQYPVAYEMLKTLQASLPDRDLEAERLLLEVAASSHNHLLALRQLDVLAEIDPENRLEYVLRRAQIRLQGNQEKFRQQAVADLEAIAASEDVDARVLENLARVYEQLGDTEGALGIYRQAFDKAGLHEKRRLILELTRLQVQAGGNDGAIDAFTDLIAAETDLVQRRKELDAQIGLATRSQSLSKLVEDYENLHRRSALDPFYAEALATIYERVGRFTEAFALIKKAYYSSRSRDGYLLERMRKLAAETKDVDAAIYYQKQLVADPENRADAAEWHKLIEMLELDLEVREADRIRVRLESKFAHDPDVLRELSDYYLETRQPSAARRVLGRMVRLRPWDTEALLTLGILEREAGHQEAAAQWLFQVIEQSADEARLREAQAGITRFPLRGLSRLGRPVVRGGDKELTDLVASLDGLKLVDRRLQVKVVHYLESGRSEFQAVPGQAESIRLRAIEELGELLVSGGVARRKSWERFWASHPPVDDQESLWVAWCSGDYEAAWPLLRSSLGASAELSEEFLFSVFGLRLGRVAELIEWATVSPDSAEMRARRRNWMFVALYHCSRDPGRELSREALEAVLESGLLGHPQIYELMTQLNRNGRTAEALRIGELAWRSRPSTRGVYEYRLASLAFGVGDVRKQRDYLERAIDSLDPAEMPFQDAVEALFLIEEGAGDRNRLLERAFERLGGTPRGPRKIFARARFLEISGDREGSAQALEELVESRLDAAKKIHSTITGTFVNEASQWISLADFAQGAQRFGLWEAGRPAFSAALDHFELVAPRSPESATQFQQFFQQQALWEFEDLSFSERKAFLRSHRTVLGSHEARENLARTLAARDYHRDTVEIYR
ncbi:MAG: tetratricopeptide repeat protein, partial [Verrucomicrobiales bacterium]